MTDNITKARSVLAAKMPAEPGDYEAQYAYFAARDLAQAIALPALELAEAAIYRYKDGWQCDMCAGTNRHYDDCKFAAFNAALARALERAGVRIKGWYRSDPPAVTEEQPGDKPKSWVHNGWTPVWLAITPRRERKGVRK